MHDELPCTLVAWEEVHQLCRELVRQIRATDYHIDLIVAIARGGYVPGRIVSDMLGVHDLTGFKIEHYRKLQKHREAFVKYPLSADVNGKNILLLDDVSDSGDTFAVGIEHIHRRGQPNAIRTAALHYKTVSSFIPDFFVDTISEWRWLIYPWAINEDLSTLIMEMRLDHADTALLQRQLKRRHGIDVTVLQIEDALLLCRLSTKS